MEDSAKMDKDVHSHMVKTLAFQDISTQDIKCNHNTINSDTLDNIKCNNKSQLCKYFKLIITFYTC
jgi:hypothetical protein